LVLKQYAGVRDEALSSVPAIEPHLDPDAVRQQLERIVASPLFSHSRRYSSLLRYLVEATLDGRSDSLKERTVGVEAFGRVPSYDTSADPVVRTTAAQLRHRIAQYYSQPGHEHEIRIGLPQGAYVAEFRAAAGVPDHALPVSVELTPLLTVAPAVPAKAPLIRPWRRAFAAVASVLLIALAVTAFAWLRTGGSDASLRQFWSPVWDSTGSVLLCIGGGQTNASSRTATGSGDQSGVRDTGPTVVESLRANSVAWPDAMVTAELAGLVRMQGRIPKFRKSGLIAFADLRESPDILVGGFNNQWIMRLGNNLRFRYVRDHDADLSFIQDQQNPTRRDWGVHFQQPYSSFLQDYGVITRVLDPSTEKTVVIASGIASYGTMAAGEFLTEEKYMRMLADRAPRDWAHKNLQVVFSTEVISGNAGPPRILATYFW
jgi:hypothetical protein